MVKKCSRTCGGCEEKENDDVTTKLPTVKPTVFPTTTRSTINSTSLPGTGRDLKIVKNDRTLWIDNKYLYFGSINIKNGLKQDEINITLTQWSTTSNLLGDLTNRVMKMELLLDEMSFQSSIHTQKLDAIDGMIIAVGEFMQLL